MRSRGRPRHPDILTPREWEVLSLIEKGASNEEIAERLGITERTAKYHVSEILSKKLACRPAKRPLPLWRHAPSVLRHAGRFFCASPPSSPPPASSSASCSSRSS